MGFIELFFKGKEEIKPRDIQLFISQKVEENINLDYKDIRAYPHTDDLAIHVSSFANSEGGLMILGVSEEEESDDSGKIIRIYPKEITWGQASLTKEGLENKLLSKIVPPITELMIKPVRKPQTKQVIFLIDIPKSDFAPHMAPDKRYHWRTNFCTSIMEHYQISHFFRINWTMKEKLVEKIYEPLSTTLEKHAETLLQYSAPFSHDIEEILSRTYYKMQMPWELLEEIEVYKDRLEDLNTKGNFARRASYTIINKIVLEHLKTTDFTEYNQSTENLEFEFTALGQTSSWQISGVDLHRILMKNQKIQTYVNRYPPHCL